jgi:hypothetical protein
MRRKEFMKSITFAPLTYLLFKNNDEKYIYVKNSHKEGSGGTFLTYYNYEYTLGVTASKADECITVYSDYNWKKIIKKACKKEGLIQ